MPGLRVVAWLLLAACESSSVPVCLHDEFDAIDSGRWTPMQPSHTSARDGRLVIAPPPGSGQPNDSTHDGLRGASQFDMTDGFAEIEVVSYLLPDETKQQSVFAIRRDEQNQFFMTADSQFHMRRRIDSAEVEVAPPLPLDQVGRFWRIEHASSTDRIRFVTSVDRRTWVLRHEEATPFPLDALIVQLEADSYNGGLAQPGTAEFDKLIVAAPGCDDTAHEIAPHGS